MEATLCCKPRCVESHAALKATPRCKSRRVEWDAALKATLHWKPRRVESLAACAADKHTSKDRHGSIWKHFRIPVSWDFFDKQFSLTKHLTKQVCNKYPQSDPCLSLDVCLSTVWAQLHLSHCKPVQPTRGSSSCTCAADKHTSKDRHGPIWRHFRTPVL